MNKNTTDTRAGYLAHLETMRNHEKDVDAFLEANRLERHESTRRPVNPLAVAGVSGVAAVMCTALYLGYQSGHFITALIGCGVVAFVGCVFAAMALCK